MQPNSPSPMREQFNALPAAFREPLPGPKRAMEDPAVQATEAAKAKWDALSPPTLNDRPRLRGEVAVKQIAARATPDTNSENTAQPITTDVKVSAPTAQEASEWDKPKPKSTRTPYSGSLI